MTKERTAHKQLRQSPKHRSWWKRGFRILGRALLVLLLILILLLLFIRSPWGQDIIVGKITNYISEKTHTEVAIDKLFISFSGKIELDGLYLEDAQGDTLIYSRELEAAIPIWPVIKGEPISINRLEWNGLRAYVTRKDSIHGFNFQFLIDAFASDSTTVEPDTTTSPPPEISIGSIDFSDFKVIYKDAVSGMEAQLDLGEFHFQGDDIDLEKMRFEVDEITLKNTSISYVLTQATPPKETDTTSVTNLPFFRLGKLQLENVNLHYQSVPDGMIADARLSDFLLTVPKVDLTHQQVVVDQLLLSNADLQFSMEAQKTKKPTAAAASEKTDSLVVFEWPDWNVQVGEIALKDNHLHYQNGPISKNTQGFNPNNIELSDFTLEIEALSLTEEEQFTAQLNALSFREASGMTLQKLHFLIDLDTRQLRVDNFDLVFNHSSISASFRADYPSLSALINQPADHSFTLNLDHFLLDPKDAFALQPDLQYNAYFNSLSQKKIQGSLKAEGSLAQLNLKKFIVKWGANTRLQTRGYFRHLTQPDKLFLAVEELKFNTLKKDVIHFIPEDSLGIALPKSIVLKSQIHGQLDSLKTETQLITSDGNISLKGYYKQQQEMAFDANLEVENLALGQLLKNPDIDQLSFTLKAVGHGDSVSTMTADLKANFSELGYKGYDFSALQFQGEMEHGEGNLKLTYDDYNLKMKMLSDFELDSNTRRVNLDFNLKGADLKALGLTQQELKAALQLSAKLVLTKDKMNLQTQIAEGTLIYKEEAYHLGAVDLFAMLHQDSTSVDIHSDFLNGKLRSNANVSRLSTAIGHQFERYFSDTIQQLSDSVSMPARLEANLEFHPNKMITEVFVPEIKEMDTLQLQVNFNQEKDVLKAQMSLPYLNYADNVIDSLGFKISATEQAGQFVFGFKKLDAGAFVMNPTFLKGDLENSILNISFNSLDDENKPFYLIKTQISGKNDSLKLHVLSKKLLIKGESWHTPTDNQLRIEGGQIVAHNFFFSRAGQKVTLANDLEPVDKNNIGIGFKNFSLANLMALFNEDEYMASGDLQGNIVLVDPLGKLGFIANFGITDLEVLQAALGNLKLEAISKKEDHYQYDLSLKGQDVDLKLHGNYKAVEEPRFELALNIDRFGFETIDKLSGENLKEGEGYLSGKIQAEGAVNNPDYHGFIRFNEASFRIAQLNSKFYLTRDKIVFDKKGITLNNFSIGDENHHKLSIDGTILTEDFSNPEFDLSFDATDFQVMNSTEEDHEDYYGLINFDATGNLTGTLDFPKVEMNISVNENTDFTYVLSETQAALEKREGIVEFVNKAHPDNILTRDEDSVKVAKITGMQLHARINVDPEATFGVVVDPRTGDNLQISGEAALDFRILPNGQMTLTGRYTVNDGHYEMSLYNLVKRKFYFQKGSTIKWNGDPMDASLDFTAIYKLKASAADLMAMQISAVGSVEQNKYRQALPFWVLMHINGTLDNPDLSFGLNMPEEAQGAIGGSVYTRVNQLNQNKAALNKQVFSLLVLNRFYPLPGSDGSRGGVASVARDNLNKALSDQLNAFSDKLMGDTGVQLNFGLESYTDYQGKSAETRTDLNITAQKTLFNDRLVVRAGTDVNVQGETHPGEENAFLGNVSIAYLLTPDGRWRIRGFRKSQYENIIDGQVFVNGIGLVFQYQFNRFRQLWKGLFTRLENPEKEQKKQEKDAEDRQPNKTLKEDS